jgi:KAP family P-loop domain
MTVDTASQSSELILWSDEPATVDLLSFDAIAATVVDALFDDSLNPVALGVSGSWGSGKTTILNLIAAHVTARSDETGKTVLVVRADPWRYDPAVGPKESLIAEVLSALQAEFKGSDPAEHAASKALKKLVKRVNWSKAIKMAARTALTVQLPSLDDVLELVNDDPESLESDKGMDGFREDFEALLHEPALEHVSQVVVLVDDLDRCLPETVVETLEAIRLFLSAEGMSFVIAADEQRVAEAIQQKLQASPSPAGTESVASLYLHKIVQTTVPVPALSYFDTRAYLFLLLAKSEVADEIYRQLISGCGTLRSAAGSLDDLELPTTYDLSLHMATASRLTPILYEKFQGNPRRIKRFLNDLYIRQSVARRRGITLEADAIAKLMVIERLFESDFKDLLEWLAAGRLRDQLDALQTLAKGGSSSPEKDGKTKPGARSAAADTEFSGTMIRWAKLPPDLDATEVSGYLTLAAAFQGRLLVDESLPEKLRDLAAALTSSSQVDQKSVKTEELGRLPSGDVVELLAHLGRRMQDDPSIQLATVNAIVTLAELHPEEIAEARAALAKLPGQELKPSTVLLLRGKAAAYDKVLRNWEATAGNGSVKKAVTAIRESHA